MKTFQLMCASLIFISLSACGPKLNGIYSTGNGMTKSTYTFKSNGKVQLENMIGKLEFDYELDGKDIKISQPGGAGPTAIMTIIDSDTIEGPMGMKLVKIK